MNDASDVTQAVLAARELERILRERYRAWGNGLGGKARFLQKKLPPDVFGNLLYVAQVSNTLRHEQVNALPDKARFDAARAALEKFFKETIAGSASLSDSSRIEYCVLNALPMRYESSVEKRLFVRTAGRVTVYPPGTHWLWRRHHTEAGYVSMLPMSLARLEAGPLRSSDGLDFGMSLDLAAVVNANDSAIIALVLSEQEQIQLLRRQVQNALQSRCCGLTYTQVTNSMHEIAGSLTYNGTLGTTLRECSLLVASCSVVEIELEDAALEECRREERRAIEAASRRATEQRFAADRERYERVQQAERLKFEQLLAEQAAEHEARLAGEKAQLVAAQEKQRQQLQRDLQLSELEVARARAEVAALQGGFHALWPKESFANDAKKIERDREVLRVAMSENRMLEFIRLGMTNNPELFRSQGFMQLASQLFGIQLSEGPLALKEGPGDRKDSPGDASAPPTPPVSRTPNDKTAESAGGA